MQRQAHTEIAIRASAERVWECLVDIDQYPNWNPLVPRLDGRLVVGSVMRLVERPSSGRWTVRTNITILALRPMRELRWRGKWLSEAVLSGEHVFEIRPLGPRRTIFVHREIFGGILAPAFWALFRGHLLSAFERMNRALKERVEEPGAFEDVAAVASASPPRTARRSYEIE